MDCVDSPQYDHNGKHPLISLIVPVWNDDELAVKLVNDLQVNPAFAEWIVVAIQPGPALHELHARRAIRLISWDKPSRGAQMNAGAAQARGSLVCFHHADS